MVKEVFSLPRRGRSKLTRMVLGLFLLMGPAGLSAQYSERQEPRPILIPEDFSSAAEEAREPIAVQHYGIEAELLPQSNELKAKVQIRFQARENISSVEFELNNNLLPTNITDEKGQTLSARRIADSLNIEVSLKEPLSIDQTATITFEYEGKLADAQYSPVEGGQLAYIG